MSDELERHKAQREALARTRRAGRDLVDMISRYLGVAARQERTTHPGQTTAGAPHRVRQETPNQHTSQSRQEPSDRDARG
ncbi:hypothetical protein ABN034_28950 [Actinopolymorpha sp. B11F2]|uniref:hypothetical protein n=1 Tax=Actinopolymorpha sp. B11F2 TaxID=3160862 RepID=UPI0032E37758